MRTRRRRRLPLIALAGLFGALAACSDDPTSTTNPLFDTWNITSFQGLGQDFIAQGMTMTITFAENGVFTAEVANDLIGTCGGTGLDCTDTGAFAATATQITIDPASPEEVVFDYVIQGNTMTFTGEIDGIPVTIVLSRA